MENEQEIVGQPENQEAQTIHQRNDSQKSQAQNSKWQYYWIRLQSFIKECRRVVKVIQKPNKEEFITIAKVSALGLAIIGMIGFILSMIQQLLLP